MICRPVYEYPLNGQWIMLDMDDGYVLWTGIWKGEHPPRTLPFAPSRIANDLRSSSFPAPAHAHAHSPRQLEG